jgi:threonine/homoserine/homoserine lactone efflux protein
MNPTETSGYIITGALLGFTAGVSPGPLLTLVISETIKRGKTEGIKVALVPLISDLPIITLAVLTFSKLFQFNGLMSLISFLGGLYLVFLGYECIKSDGLDIDIKKHKPESLKKGLIVNILNPHPYLFWITVGTPLAFKAYQISVSAAILFFISFYSMLVGSKICIALLVESSRSFLTNIVCIWLMRILGFSLFGFAALFFFESIKKIL